MLRNVIVSTKNVPQTQGEKSHIFNFMKKDTVSLNVYFKSWIMILYYMCTKIASYPKNCEVGIGEKEILERKAVIFYELAS